jgi:GTP-binding protein
MRIVETQLISSAGRIDDLPEAGLPEVAFAGRSNVGKSSLLNALSNRRNLFKVSKTPGRTRTIVHVETRLDSDARIFLVDLPGYGYAKVARKARDAWGPLIETYLSTRPTLHLVVILVDLRRGPESEEAGLFEFLSAHGIPALLVATKSDKVPRSKQKAHLNRLARDTGIEVLAVSSKNNQGLDRLLSIVARASGYS